MKSGFFVYREGRIKKGYQCDNESEIERIFSMKGNQQIVCPKRQYSDRVQKVSAIVAQGTKVVEEDSTIYTETSDGSDYIPVTYDSVRRTPLARKLAPLKTTATQK
jgi:hypothetical protein